MSRTVEAVPVGAHEITADSRLGLCTVLHAAQGGEQRSGDRGRRDSGTDDCGTDVCGTDDRGTDDRADWSSHRRADGGANACADSSTDADTDTHTSICMIRSSGMREVSARGAVPTRSRWEKVDPLTVSLHDFDASGSDDSGSDADLDAATMTPSLLACSNGTPCKLRHQPVTRQPPQMLRLRTEKAAAPKRRSTSASGGTITSSRSKFGEGHFRGGER